MTSEAITEWAAVATAAATIMGVLGSGTFAAFRALAKRFDKLEERRNIQFKGMRDHVEQLYNNHETVDQQRHRDNLLKFDAQDKVLLYIRLALARAGLNGADHDHRDPEPH